MRVFFWKGLVFELMDWVNDMAFSSMGEHHPIHQGPEETRQRQVTFALCLTTVDRALTYSWPWSSWLLVPGFWTGIYTIHSLALRLYTTPPAFLGFQCAESRLWKLFIVTCINTFNKSFLVRVCVYIYIYTYLYIRKTLYLMDSSSGEAWLINLLYD